MRGLGEPPGWASGDEVLCQRWRDLELELGLPAAARPAAEVWLASYAALLEIRKVNDADGAEAIDSSKVLAQLRQATTALEPYRVPVLDDHSEGLRIVR